MLSAAIRRWKHVLSRIQVAMRPYFAPSAWVEVENLAIDRYFISSIEKFPLTEGSRCVCSNPQCPNGTLVQGVPPLGGVPAPFILRWDEPNASRVSSFELDHIVEVATTCQKWADARKQGVMTSRWDSGFDSSEAADKILEDLFSPAGTRWRCGVRMSELGGDICHYRAFSFQADRRKQKQLMTCQRCMKAFDSQPALAAHTQRCERQCMICGQRFPRAQGCRIHTQGCSARRAAAERDAQGEDQSPVF